MRNAIALAALLSAGSAFAASVTWQCDMNVKIGLGEFTPATQEVVVRGAITDWCAYSIVLTDTDNDGIYTGSFDHTGVPAQNLEYKYVYRNTGAGGWCDGVWEFLSNRSYDWAGSDLTLPVQCFNDVCDTPGTCDVEITFVVDMGVQEATGAFDPGAGDIVVVRGGTSPLQWGGTDYTCANIGGSLYAVTVPFLGQAESNAVEHKFVIVGGGDNWESSANRLAYSDCSWTDSDGDGLLDGSLAPVYFSNVNWDNITDHDVLVTFDVDASRVSCFFANGGAPVYNGIASYGDVNYISVHGFFNGWPAWDGTIGQAYQLNGDGACSWTGSVLFPAGSAKNQIYKFGLNGFDNEAGFGQDHSLNLGGDGGTGLLTVAIEFGSNGSNWDCFSGCYETVDAHELPSAFALSQNVPNPFNPSTTISYTVAETGMASLKVYDLAGHAVATLVDGMVDAGNHSVVFDASELASGVYLYTLQSGASVQSQKMVLVK